MSSSEPSYPTAAGAPETPLRESPAKRPRTVLAGPYGHPFHPILVTVPIGAWVSVLVFDIASRVSNDYGSALARGSFLLLCIGLVTALLAAVFGTMDLMGIPSRTPAASTALTHMALNTLVLVVMAISALVRQDQGLDEVRTLPLVLTVIGLLLLGGSGFLGGKLSYHYGVRVAAEKDQISGYTRRPDPVDPGPGATSDGDVPSRRH